MPESTLDTNNEVRAASIETKSPEVEDEPITFQEAWHHPDDVLRSKWKDAIKKTRYDSKRCLAETNKGFNTEKSYNCTK